MIIDIHTHVADLREPAAAERTGVTFDKLIARLDDEGIDKAVLLPMPVTAESTPLRQMFYEWPDPLSQVREGLRRSDRLIVFGSLDPRQGGNRADTDFSWALEQFGEMGCVGIGEVTANLEADDARVVNMFRQCGRWGLPVTIHGTARGAPGYGLIDDIGSPRLARLLDQIPDTVVLGHGPGFWAEIGPLSTLAEKAAYPKGPIDEEGSLWGLLREHRNLHCDISAYSGHNALTRDEGAGVRFLNEFQDRVLFGTDVCFGDARGRMPHLATLLRFLSAGELTEQAFEQITYGNALRVLTRRQGA